MSPGPRGVRELAAPADSRLFHVDLEALPEPATLLPRLDRTEQVKAARLRVQDARTRFVRRRWIRRRLLAEVHGLAEADIHIRTDPLGRPLITAPKSLASLTLSTSSAGPHALVAWSLQPGVGVDVARVDPAVVSVNTAAVFMHPAERRAWEAAEDPTEVFHRCWTRKEAVLKALGTGFQTDPRTIDALHDPRPIEFVPASDCLGAIVVGFPSAEPAS